MERVVLMIIPAMICGILCISCGTKAETDDCAKLKGSIWETETNDVVFTLRFVDETECTIGTTLKDGTLSTNLTTYYWRYASNVDSRWGLFHLYYKGAENKKGEWSEYAFPGTIENKKLFLGIHDKDKGIEGLWFKRKK